MKTIRTFLTLASAMVLASCSQDENLRDMVGGEMMTITVGMPDNSKVSRVNYDESVEGNQLRTSLTWNKDDQIFVAGYNGEEYLGSKIFHYEGEDNATQGTFIGMAFKEATHYKVYYKNAGLTLDEQGVPTFNYQSQTQTAEQVKPTDHLKDCLYLSTTDKITAEAFSQTFMLNMQNALLCYDIQNVKPDLGALTKIALTTNAGESDAKTVELATSGEFTYPHQFYLSFDPAALSQTGGKKLSVSLYGDKVYRVSTLVASDKTYAANTRYAVNIDTKPAEGVLSTWENENGVLCPVMELAEAQKEIAAEAAGNLTFAVTVNHPTEAQPAAQTDAEWIKNIQVSALTEGQATVSYAVDANETANAREGVITVNYAGAESVTYTVKQAGKVPTPVLSLTETQKEVAAEAASGFTFTVSVENPAADVQPAGETAAAWIKDVQVTALEGGQATVSYAVDANETTEVREGTITIKYAGAENVTYTVKQAGKVLPPALALTETQKEVAAGAASGLSFAFSVANPVAGVQPAVETTATWIKNVQVSAFANGSGTVTYDVDASEVSELREGVITVNYTGAQSVTYTVKQAAMAPARLTSAKFNNSGVLVGMSAQQYAGVTYEALVNFSSFGVNNTVIGQEGNFLLRVGDDKQPNNEVQLCIAKMAENATDTNGDHIIAQTRLAANKWYHLAGTIRPSGAGVEIALYVNGIEEARKVFPNVPMPALGGDGIPHTGDNDNDSPSSNLGVKRGIFIGRLPNFKWGERPMNGMMREVRVWSVVRTADQIKNNMLSVDAASAGLEAYYKFDGSDVSGTTVTDASGKHHNGTVKAGTITATEHDAITL